MGLFLVLYVFVEFCLCLELISVVVPLNCTASTFKRDWHGSEREPRATGFIDFTAKLKFWVERLLEIL